MKDWKKITIKDLEEIYRLVKENHPGPVDPYNTDPIFRKWFNAGYTKTLVKTKNVNSFEDYKKIITYYCGGFQDKHTRIDNVEKEKSRLSKISKFTKNGVWISIPSFRSDTKKEINSFKKVIRSLKDLRSKDIVVFDLRQNHGGNSYIYFNSMVIT